MPVISTANTASRIDAAAKQITIELGDELTDVCGLEGAAKTLTNDQLIYEFDRSPALPDEALSAEFRFSQPDELDPQLAIRRRPVQDQGHWLPVARGFADLFFLS